MKINEVLLRLVENKSGFCHKILLENLLDNESSALFIYLTPQEEIDSIEEGVYIPPSVQLFRQCQRGHVPSLIEALKYLGDILGYDTQIIFPRRLSKEEED